MIRLFFILLSGLLLSLNIYGQETTAKGVILDGKTNEPIPFVNIIFDNTTIGTTSDTIGHYILKANIPVSIISFSAIGYVPAHYPVKSGRINEMQIKLLPNNFDLEEISVKPDNSPAYAMLKKIQDNKERNNPENYSDYSYRRYTRLSYQINNVTDNMADWKIFSQNGGIFQYDNDSNRYMPVYFSEQVVFNEYQREPLRRKSTIEADNTKGLGLLQDAEITGFASGLEAGVNFYNNTIEIMGQNFISPAADNGRFFYNYYLLDSTDVNNGKQYVLRFTPRRIGDNTFTGQIVLEDRFYSIVEVDADLTNTEHLNFIKKLHAYSTYKLVNDSIPFFEESKITTVIDYMPVEFNKDKHRVELLFVNSQNFSDVTVGKKEEVVLSHKKLTYESLKDRHYTSRGEEFWVKSRPAELSSDDNVFKASIDSVNQLPFVRFLDKLSHMTLSGYYDLGKFELGPYDYMLNFNEVEDTHLFIGGRTSNEISEDYSIWGGIGYGTRNKQWLGRIGGGYMLPSSRRNILKFEYTDDIVLIGENEKILLLYENKQNTSESNLVSHIFKRDELDELLRRQRVVFTFEKEFRTGFTVKSMMSGIRYHSPAFYPFISGTNEINSFEVAEMNLNFRWSWEEKYLDYGYRRIYAGTPYPIINLSCSGGVARISGEDEPYARVHSSLKHYFFIGQSRFDYAIEGGAILGTVPYPLLDIPRANETYGFQSYNFNMMNNLEFVHDRYLHSFMEYRLHGFLFKRIPIIKHLSLREVLSAKAMIGDVSAKHLQLLNFPNTIASWNNEPYAEVGLGAENIFRFFRLDFVWRLSKSNEAPRFGLRARMEIKI